MLQHKWTSVFSEVLKMLVLINVQNHNFGPGTSLDSHPLHFQKRKTESLRASVISPVSHSWFVEGQDKNLGSWARDLPNFPLQRLPETGIPADPQGHQALGRAHLVPIKSNRGKRATAFSRIHFIPRSGHRLGPLWMESTQMWSLTYSKLKTITLL